MDLTLMRLAESRRQLETTVLYREGGQWSQQEVTKLVNGLMTEVSQHPQHPEYVILFGHYAKEQTLEALGGGSAYVATRVTGLEGNSLPFKPGFV